MTHKILVADDDTDNASMLAQLLEASGYETAAAFSGSETISKIKSWHPAVVLLDIYMPGIDGHQVAREVRASAETDDIGLIAITGYGDDDDRRRAEEEGFDVYLTKPVDFDALLKLLESSGF